MGPPIFIGGNKPFLFRASTWEGSFNGAADFHRRKWRIYGMKYGQNPASMGPPIFIGGNNRQTDLPPIRIPGFNGAADFHRRKFCRRYRTGYVGG